MSLQSFLKDLDHNHDQALHILQLSEKNNLKKMDYSAIDADEEEMSFTRGYD